VTTASDADDITCCPSAVASAATSSPHWTTSCRRSRQAKLEQFTQAKLDSAISRVDDAIDRVRAINPAAADAIAKNPELQLAMADYDNQFGSMGPQFVSYLAGSEVKLQGGKIQAGDPPTRTDLQTLVESTKYGMESPKAVAQRDAHFETAMNQLGITATTTPSHRPAPAPGAGAASTVLVNGAHGDSVRAMQQKLADLGYTGKDGAPLVADGHFGPGTLRAVQQFQHDHQLTVDGKAGTGTLGALEAATQQRQQQAESAAPSMATPGHADNLRYQQVMEKLEALEQQRSQGGLSPLFQDRGQLENAAGQVAYESKVVGMSQVDIVVARPTARVCSRYRASWVILQRTAPTSTLHRRPARICRPAHARAKR